MNYWKQYDLPPDVVRDLKKNPELHISKFLGVQKQIEDFL